jgi:cytochrome c oxidase subunit II
MLYLASQKIVDAVDGAFWTLTIACLILMIGTMGAMVLFAFKYHRSRHPKPARISGNMKLEIIWTIIPTIIGAWMFFVGWEGFEIIRTVPEGAHVIEVRAQQWSWTFTHPKSGVSDSELVVPAGVPIRCNLSSSIDDVLHSFYIPAYRVKEDCVPGLDTYLWFEAEVGTYNIFCAEFCGTDHAKMITKLRAVPMAEYKAYIRKQAEMMNAPVESAADVMAGDTAAMLAAVPDVKQLYATYCQSCHGGQGQGGLVEGARSFRDDPVSKWKKGVKITEIFNTISTGLDGTRMKSFANLSAWQRFALAHYVAGFSREGAGRSAATEAEFVALIKANKLDEQKSVVLDMEDRVEAAIEELAQSK